MRRKLRAGMVRARRRGVPLQRIVSIGVITAAVLALVVAAVKADGYKTPAFDLHDAGIWVTQTQNQTVGRYNTEIKSIDTQKNLGAPNMDLLQSGASVLIDTSLNDTKRTLIGMDPRTTKLTSGPDIQANAVVAMGGPTGAILDNDSGRVWVTSSNTLPSVSFKPESPATETIQGPGDLTVGVDGLTHVLETSTGNLQTLSLAGAVRDRTHVDIGVKDADPKNVQMTAVGSTPAILLDGRLYLAGHKPVDLRGLGSDWKLQQAGPSASSVVVATSDMLLRIPLDGGPPQRVSDAGTGGPAQPVVIGNCAYAAWGNTPTLVKACGKVTGVAGASIKGLPDSSHLVFRSNRGRVIINETIGGSVVAIAADGSTEVVNDWNQALADPSKAEHDKVTEFAKSEKKQVNPPINTAPTAKDDTYGTRKGRAIVIHPLENDSDPEGDVLSIINPLCLDSQAPSVPDRPCGITKEVSISIIDGGQAIQVEPALDKMGSFTFPYHIDDGHKHPVSANIVINIVDDKINNPPITKEDSRLSVAQGGTITHDVLENDIDPDGDSLTLAPLPEFDPKAGTVETDPAGVVIFHAAADFVGKVDITYTVADDRKEDQKTAKGHMLVDVTPKSDNLPPEARNDHASTFVGREVTVDVLANDSDPDLNPLAIVSVKAFDLSGVDVRWTAPSREIHVTAPSQGTVNIYYTITDGRSTSVAILRVDVAEPLGQRPPVAVRDDVILRPGVPAFAAVLDNDIDPNGDVLVVSSIELSADAGIRVEILDRSVLRITSDRPLEAPTEVRYVVTDGTGFDTGTVRVRPSPPQSTNQPPLVRPDEFTVRVGTVATLDVLANDSDPDADTLALIEPDAAKDPAKDGRLFVHAGVLRFEAPATARSEIEARYNVEDQAHNRVSGVIRLHVLANDPAKNNAPIAPTLIARTVTGQDVVIPIPVEAMDPDGDPVTLVGIGTPPGLGSVRDVGTDRVTYKADAGPTGGTDHFTYRVQDPFGAEATGTILVGVAPPASRNNNPVAIPDFTQARPGTKIGIDVLANDGDPDGDRLSLSTGDKDQPILPLDQGIVSRDGNRLSFEAPKGAKEGSKASFSYVVNDGRGGRAVGTVEVTVTGTIGNRTPIAEDDVLAPQVAGTLVGAEVLKNDHDPDEDTLTVSEVSLPGATVGPDGIVHFLMPATSVSFTYVVDDGQGGRTRAAVLVPVAGQKRPPVARDDEGIKVKVGETVQIPVLDNDESDPKGATLVLRPDLQGIRHGTATVAGRVVTFTASEKGYVGDAGFSYLVADADTPGALTALGSVRITIEGSRPPTFTELPVDVAQDDQANIDLNLGVVDPDPGDAGKHRYVDFKGDDKGVSHDLVEGHILVVKAARDAGPGTVVPLHFQVVDPSGGTAEGTVTVTVIESHKPLPVVNPDTARTLQGQKVSIPVTANDVNPIPDKPLTIVNIGPASSGGGVGKVSGGSIDFQPSPVFFGDTTFTYTVQDGLGQLARQVTGTVTVTVIGRPSAPSAPTGTVESHVVHLTWGVAAANGAPITKYSIRASDGSTRETPSNAFDYQPLTNGVEYTFTVVATNEAGDSPASGSSLPLKPDLKPDQPAPPTVLFGDQVLNVTWSPPTVDGTPIDKYTLTISPPDTHGVGIQDFGAGQVSFPWPDLLNGTAYTFKVKAHNAAGFGDDSPPSAPETPAGKPGPPAKPTVAGGNQVVTVSWIEPTDTNGDAIKSYSIGVYVNSALQSTVPVSNPGQRSYAINSASNGDGYSFEVTATNKAGAGSTSLRSDVFIPSGTPLAPGPVTATEGDTQSTLTFTAADGNGDPAPKGTPVTSHVVSINGGAFVPLASDNIVRGLSNGTVYTFRVAGTNKNGLGDPSASSNPINPYGVPGTPSVSGSSSGNTLNWSWSTPSGNGRTVDSFDVRLDGGSVQGGLGTSFSRTFRPGECHTLEVYAHNLRGNGNPGSSRPCTPPSTVTIVKAGSAVGQPGCSDASCKYVTVQLRNFAPGSVVTIDCQAEQSGGGTRDYATYFTYSVTVDGAGNKDSTNCYYGFPGRRFRIVAGGIVSNEITW